MGSLEFSLFFLLSSSLTSPPHRIPLQTKQLVSLTIISATAGGLQIVPTAPRAIAYTLQLFFARSPAARAAVDLKVRFCFLFFLLSFFLALFFTNALLIQTRMLCFLGGAEG